MKTLTFCLRILLGICLFVESAFLCGGFVFYMFRGKLTLVDRLMSVLAILLFASMAFFVWRILIFRRGNGLSSPGPSWDPPRGPSRPPSRGGGPEPPLAPVPRPPGGRPPRLSAAAEAKYEAAGRASAAANGGFVPWFKSASL